MGQYRRDCLRRKVRRYPERRGKVILDLGPRQGDPELHGQRLTTDDSASCTLRRPSSEADLGIEIHSGLYCILNAV